MRTMTGYTCLNYKSYFRYKEGIKYITNRRYHRKLHI